MIAIYQIRNLINNKLYVGSAVDFRKRKNMHVHKLRKDKHHSDILQKAWKKYGENNFIFEMLEECTKETLLVREQHFLDTLQPDYNICKKAGSTTGVPMKAHVKEALRKSKENYIVSEETRKRQSDAKKGVKYSPDSVQKRIETKKRKYNGDVMSKEGRANVSRLNSIRLKKPPKEKKIRLSIKGKTFEERYGEEKAKQTRLKISIAAKNRDWKPQSEDHKQRRANSKKSKLEITNHNTNEVYMAKGIKDFCINSGVSEQAFYFAFHNTNGYMKKLNVTAKRI